MAITVYETAKRYSRLLEFAKILVFSVEEHEDYMLWKDKNNFEYILYPYVEGISLPQFDIDTTVIAVCLDGPAKKVAENEVSFDEIEALCKKVVDNDISVEQAHILWNTLFGNRQLGTMLELFGSNKEKPELISEVDVFEEELESSKRTTVVTACGPEVFIDIISKRLNKRFKAWGKKMYISDEKTIVLQLVSKLYERKNYDEYWYSIHSYQITEMDKYPNGYYSFGFSGRDVTVLIEKEKMQRLIPYLTESPNNGDTYWHIKINTNIAGDFYVLKTKKSEKDIDITHTDGILILDERVDSYVNEVSADAITSRRITLHDTELREVFCKMKRR